MIHSPSLFIDSLPYRADLKVILHHIAQFRLAGHRAQFSWDKQEQWIGKSRRILAKLHKSEGWLNCVKKIRRGKKQTNLYYLAPWLWAKLIEGRKVHHVKGAAGEQQPPPAGRPCNLLALYGAELAKAG